MSGSVGSTDGTSVDFAALYSEGKWHAAAVVETTSRLPSSNRLRASIDRSPRP
jgi:hypothetical protein